ncbi:MAG: preprotein translocase subunit SecG [Bacteroidaceae bacterium]
MYSIVIVLIVLAAVLMCLIVLIQESKGGGLAAGFSGANSLGGVRKTTEFVEKATWGLAIAMVVLSVAAAYLSPAKTVQSSVVEGAPIQTTAPAVPNPAANATQTATPQTATPAAEQAPVEAETPAKQ